MKTPTTDLGCESRPLRRAADFVSRAEKERRVVELLHAAGRPLDYETLASELNISMKIMSANWRPVVVRPAGRVVAREYRTGQDGRWRTHLLLAEWLETGETETEKTEDAGGE